MTVVIVIMMILGVLLGASAAAKAGRGPDAGINRSVGYIVMGMSLGLGVLALLGKL